MFTIKTVGLSLVGLVILGGILFVFLRKRGVPTTGCKAIVLYKPHRTKVQIMREYVRNRFSLVRNEHSNTTVTVPTNATASKTSKGLLPKPVWYVGLGIGVVILLVVLFPFLRSIVLTVFGYRHEIAWPPTLNVILGLFSIPAAILLFVFLQLLFSRSGTGVNFKRLNEWWTRKTGGDTEEGKKRRRLVLYPPVFLAIYYLAWLLLYLYKHDTWYEPWPKNPLMFFVLVPLVGLGTIGVAILERTVLRWMILAVYFGLMGPIVYEFYQDTDFMKKRDAERLAQVEIDKAEKSLRADLLRTEGSRVLTLTATPERWCRPVNVPFGYRQSTVPKQPGRLKIRVDGRKVLKYTPGEPLELGNAGSLEFMSDEPHPIDLEVTISKIR